MSREPLKRQAEAPPVTWFAAEDREPPKFPVLTTTTPERDRTGTPGRWYARRQYSKGRWVFAQTWVNPLNTVPLDPQPTHWRMDPTRGMLEVPAVE